MHLQTDARGSFFFRYKAQEAGVPNEVASKSKLEEAERGSTDSCLMLMRLVVRDISIPI